MECYQHVVSPTGLLLLLFVLVIFFCFISVLVLVIARDEVMGTRCLVATGNTVVCRNYISWQVSKIFFDVSFLVMVRVTTRFTPSVKNLSDGTGHMPLIKYLLRIVAPLFKMLTNVL